jgi:hypothetical protein
MHGSGREWSESRFGAVKRLERRFDDPPTILLSHDSPTQNDILSHVEDHVRVMNYHWINSEHCRINVYSESTNGSKNELEGIEVAGKNELTDCLK